MDDIQQRLKETSDACVASYEIWSVDKKDSKARTDMQEAIHELRKVSSRLEIELAISEREETTMKKIPIPSHRSASRGQSAQGVEDDSFGNAAGRNRTGPKPQRNRNSRPRKTGGGS